MGREASKCEAHYRCPNCLAFRLLGNLPQQSHVRRNMQLLLPYILQIPPRNVTTPSVLARVKELSLSDCKSVFLGSCIMREPDVVLERQKVLQLQQVTTAVQVQLDNNRHLKLSQMSRFGVATCKARLGHCIPPY